MLASNKNPVSVSSASKETPMSASNKNLMSETHLIHSLIKKREELKEAINHLYSQAQVLQSHLKALNQTISIFNPDYKLEFTHIPHQTRNQYFKSGELKSLVLNILKDNPASVEKEEIINRLIDLKKIEFKSNPDRTHFKSSISKSLKLYAKQGLLLEEKGQYNISYWKIKEWEQSTTLQS